MFIILPNFEAGSNPKWKPKKGHLWKANYLCFISGSFKNMDETRSIFVHFHPFLNAVTNIVQNWSII